MALAGRNLTGASFSVLPADAGVGVGNALVQSDRAGVVLSLSPTGVADHDVSLVATTVHGSATIPFRVRAAPALSVPADQSVLAQGTVEYSSLTVRGTLSGQRGDRKPLRIVVWGDVLIEGAVSVSGANGLPDNAGRPSNAGGSGGSGGGRGGDSGTEGTNGAPGLGLGGGGAGIAVGSGYASGGGGGGFGFPGDPGCFAEGVLACGSVPAALGGLGGVRNGVAHLQLLESGADDAGGSGGGGAGEAGGGGGGGGGAVLMIALGKVRVEGAGRVDASGGTGGSDRATEAGEASDDGGGGGGSGGAVWLAATEVSGTGLLRAEGGNAGQGGAAGAGQGGGNGSPGRIRLDAAVTVSTLLGSGPTRFFGPAVDLSQTPVLVAQDVVIVQGAGLSGSSITLRNVTTGQDTTTTVSGTAGTVARGTFSAAVHLTPGRNEIRISQRSTQVDVDGDGTPDDRTVQAVTGNDLTWDGSRPVGVLLVVSIP
jgi:hypothetical protein